MLNCTCIPLKLEIKETLQTRIQWIGSLQNVMFFFLINLQSKMATTAGFSCYRGLLRKWKK